MLDSKDVFIVDFGVNIYAWVGSGASKDERGRVLLHAHTSIAMVSSHTVVVAGTGVCNRLLEEDRQTHGYSYCAYHGRRRTTFVPQGTGR